MDWCDGLDGRVTLPLIMGFGCNLASLAATRTLPNAKQRLVTTLIIPYTSCAARLTIYLVIAKTTAQRTWAFVKGAGKIIIVMTLVVWLMSAIPVVKVHCAGCPTQYSSAPLRSCGHTIDKAGGVLSIQHPTCPTRR